MINFDKLSSGQGCRFILSPNCSIGWRTLVIFYAVTCTMIVSIGVFFALQGMWLVLPFSGLEMIALGGALYLTSRKVHRREVITLDQSYVRVEKGVRKVDQSWEFAMAGTRIFEESPGRYRRAQKLMLGAHGDYVEVGAFLNSREKGMLAFQLKDCIIPRCF